MRKFVSLFLLLMASAAVWAEPISRDAAQQLARDFLSQRSPQNARRSIRAARNTLALKPVSTEAYYYVFNVGESHGFVIVSGDDRTEPILGYADADTFDEQHMPLNMKAWLQGYADELRWLDAHPGSAQHRAPRMVTIKNVIHPLLATIWDQGEPYNDDCPLFLNSNRSLTGCVATAMAQVMYYHQWPAATTKEIPAYQCERNWGGSHVSVNAIPANTAFDWTNMQLSYDGSEIAAQKKAVSTLMAAVGASVEMDYADSRNKGSSAALALCDDALKTYFDYSATTTYVDRENYYLDDWMELLYNELAQSRPVLYGGQSSGGGHAFVVDGYDGAGKFHINWGWNGSNNGFFLISVLNPYNNTGSGASSSEDGYSSGQEAVIGIKMNEGETDPLVKTPPMHGNISAVNGNRVTFSAWTSLTETETFDFGIGYVDQDGTVHYLTGYDSGYSLSFGHGFPSVDVAVSGLADGTYHIVALCRIHGTDEWIPYVNANVNYALAVVAGGSITLTLVPATSLNVTSFTLPDSPKAGISQTITAHVNNAADEYYGELFLFASTSGSMGTAVASTGCTVQAGKTFPVELFYAFPNPGTYHLWVATDKDGTNVIGETSITITGTGAVTDNVDLAFTRVIAPLSADRTKLLSNRAEVQWTITNSSDQNYQGDVCFYLWTWTGGSGSGKGPVHQITVPAHGSVTWTEVFTNLQWDKEYSFTAEYVKNSDYTNNQTYIHDVFALVQAASYYLSDGTKAFVEPAASITMPVDATAVDLRGCSGITEVTGGNPNTLYFLDASSAVPAGASSNVVRDGFAENLVLYDGYDFATPFAFTANTATYDRMFLTGFDRSGNGWSTITLPFDVNGVTVTWSGNDYPIDWFRSGDDMGKNFWIMQFAREENGTVYFSQAETFKAGVPYIIAVPGAEWGNGADLTGLPLHFTASNVALSPDFKAASMGSVFTMKGTVARENVMGVYVLNDEGNHFQMNNAAVDAFRAYFAPTTNLLGYRTYSVAVDDVSTAIGDLRSEGLGKIQDADAWYRLDGTRMASPQRPGIYIHQGNKVIIK